MTVSLTTAETKLYGNGVTTIFTLPMEVQTAESLLVDLWVGDDRTALTLGVHYTVSDLDNEAGATLTYPVAGTVLAAGQYLYVRRRTDLTQQTTGNIANELDPETISAQFDKIAMQVQELNARLDRALRMATSNAPSFTPTPNAFFGTDGAGNPTLLTDVPTDLTIVSGIVVWEGESVSALEQDTDLGYSAGAAVQVAVGNIVRAGGYAYQVLDGSASTYDIVTNGGVRLQSLDPALDAFASTTTASTVNSFLAKAATYGVGLLSSGLRSLAAISANAINTTSLLGVVGTIWQRAAGVTNFVTLTDPNNVRIDSLTLNGDWGTTGAAGHGLVLVDPVDVSIANLQTSDFGGLASGNGGAGLLAYPADGSSLIPRVFVTGSKFSADLLSEKSFGYIGASATQHIVLGCVAWNFSNYGLEFKNNAEFNVMAASVGASSRYSFGTGYEGIYYSTNNVFGLLASKDSDIALELSHARKTVVVGLNAAADSPPNTFGDGNAYGLHIGTGSDENIALGVLTTGAAMDYPVRIRGNRNAVQIADYSSAARTVTINNGAGENYVELLHIGNKAETITGLIEDQNAPVIAKGPGANVYDSPLTREYFGGIRDAFTWGLDGLANSYPWYSTTGFRFEGASGQTVLGLGVKDTKEAGVRVVAEAEANEAAWLYVLSATPYWRITVNAVDAFRLEETNFLPVTSYAAGLGKASQPWGDIYGQNLRLKPATTAVSLDNETLTFVRMSNTQIRLYYKGADGVTRTSNLNFS